MQAGLQFGAHISEEVLENYAFHRLPEIDVEAIEEHLLACPKCVDRAEASDAYVDAIRAGIVTGRFERI